MSPTRITDRSRTAPRRSIDAARATRRRVPTPDADRGARRRRTRRAACRSRCFDVERGRPQVGADPRPRRLCAASARGAKLPNRREQCVERLDQVARHRGRHRRRLQDVSSCSMPPAPVRRSSRRCCAPPAMRAKLCASACSMPTERGPWCSWVSTAMELYVSVRYPGSYTLQTRGIRSRFHDDELARVTLTAGPSNSARSGSGAGGSRTHCANDDWPSAEVRQRPSAGAA